MHFLLFSTMILHLGCTDRGTPDSVIPQMVVGVDPSSKQPRSVFTGPDGFEWNDEHRIYYHKEARTSISLSHSPGTSFQSVVDDFIADRMYASNLKLIRKEFRDIDGRATLLVHAKRLNAKYPQQTCTVAYGTATGCAQLTAIYPANLDKDLQIQVVSALLNSRYLVPN